MLSQRDVDGKTSEITRLAPALAIKAAAMTSRISHTSFDALDAYAQSVFWSQVLDFIEDPDDPNKPGHEECLSRTGSTWTSDRPTARASRRPSGSSHSGRRNWPTTSGQTAAGSRSPIPKATSSASCPGSRPLRSHHLKQEHPHRSAIQTASAALGSAAHDWRLACVRAVVHSSGTTGLVGVRVLDRRHGQTPE